MISKQEYFLFFRYRLNKICRQIIQNSPGFLKVIAVELSARNKIKYKGKPLAIVFANGNDLLQYSGYTSHLEELLNSNGIIIDHSNKSTL